MLGLAEAATKAKMAKEQYDRMQANLMRANQTDLQMAQTALAEMKIRQNAQANANLRTAVYGALAGGLPGTASVHGAEVGSGNTSVTRLTDDVYKETSETHFSGFGFRYDHKESKTGIKTDATQVDASKSSATKHKSAIRSAFMAGFGVTGFVIDALLSKVYQE